MTTSVDQLLDALQTCGQPWWEDTPIELVETMLGFVFQRLTNDKGTVAQELSFIRERVAAVRQAGASETALQSIEEALAQVRRNLGRGPFLTDVQQVVGNLLPVMMCYLVPPKVKGGKDLKWQFSTEELGLRAIEWFRTLYQPIDPNEGMSQSSHPKDIVPLDKLPQWCHHPACPHVTAPTGPWFSVTVPNGPRNDRPKLKQCSRCQEATYCSPECQRAHWKVHKPACQVFASAKEVEKLYRTHGEYQSMLCGYAADAGSSQKRGAVHFVFEEDSVATLHAMANADEFLRSVRQVSEGESTGCFGWAFGGQSVRRLCWTACRDSSAQRARATALWPLSLLQPRACPGHFVLC